MTKTAKRKVVTFVPIGNPPRSLTAQYINKQGKTISLLRDARVVEGKLKEEEMDDVDSLNFDNGKVNFIIDENDEDCLDAKRVDFWRKSWNSFVPSPTGDNANTNCKKPLFTIVDHEEDAKNDILAKKLSLAVQNRVNNATPQTIFNLAFALGMKTENKTEEEVLRNVWNKAVADPAYFNQFLKREDLGSLIVIQKAVALKVIENDRGVLLYGTIPVGNGDLDSAIQQAQAYFANNEDQYKMLRKQVAYKDVLPIRFNEENVDEVVFDGEEPGTQTSKSTARNGNKK